MTAGLRVLVCGGRDFADSALLARTLDRLHRERLVEIVIEGDARGADRMAGYWARKNRITDLKFAADWAAHGKAAGPIRNTRMLAEGKPDLVVAFAGGRGTRNMIDQAREAGVEVLEVAA